MEIKTLEVKNISHYARGSEETPCYNATVYINGKKAIEISNDGRGGMDMQHQYDGFDHGIVQQANEWCKKTFGKESFKYTSGGEEETCTYDIDLEQHCHKVLYDWIDTKLLKKDLKKQWLFIEKGQLMGYKRDPRDTEDQFKKFFNTKHPNDKCLNFLPFDDALKMFKECA
jgi:hypothetical protein|tara:strand:- start:1450 stop:1962 length:513 start_codon:yes stop_codon:yes gene_type:complete